MEEILGSQQVGYAARQPPYQSASRVSSLVFFALVAVYCGWIISLPLFPSQDGAVHLYYVEVLKQLMSGPTYLSNFFAIRHPLPPYAVHYYLLLLLNRFVDLLTAEKILVGIIVGGFAYGFRFLVRRVGPAGEALSFWAIPLALNWMLGMGFHNYCLSLSVALWAMGAWLTAVKYRLIRWWLVYLALVGLMLFTHPVPLFFVLGFVATELLLRLVQLWMREKQAEEISAGVLSIFRLDALFAAISYLSLAYIALFVSHQRSVENLHQAYPRRQMIHEFLRLKPLSVVSNTFGSQLYRIFLYLMITSALLLAIQGLRRRYRTFSLGTQDLLLAIALGLGLLIPVLPRSMNGSDFFSDRLLIFVWIAALAAASFSKMIWGLKRPMIIAGGCLFALSSLGMANYWFRPVANKLVMIEQYPVTVKEGAGMFVDSPVLPEATNLTFDPYNWAGARYFRRAGLAMLNAPWIDLPILPLEPRGKIFANLYLPSLNNYPQKFRSMLMKEPEQRKRIAPLLSFVLTIGFPKIGSAAEDPLMTQVWPHAWNCERANWFSVCTPQ